ncbi:hypothetical protein C8R45DRAFT_1095744 [Mycena sanguinolenta]|nr:hypothetical protein C8R45DRAFT_1095744 [Mycena sanguinolenta]
MLNIFALTSLALATLRMAVAPASAHGYVTHPPSRQALCRDVPVLTACNGDGARFHELNEERLWVDYVT